MDTKKIEVTDQCSESTYTLGSVTHTCIYQPDNKEELGLSLKRYSSSYSQELQLLLEIVL